MVVGILILNSNIMVAAAEVAATTP
jgi:hypothetical protein